MSSPPPSSDHPLRPALKHHVSSSSEILQLKPFPTLSDKNSSVSSAENATGSSTSHQHPSHSNSNSIQFPRSRTMTHHSDAFQPCERRVSFDTFEAADEGALGGGIGVEYSVSLRVNSIGYKREKTARTFLVATDMNQHSTHALQWLLDALAEDGDEIVVLRVVDPASSDPILFKGDPEDARVKAKELLESVLEMNTHNYLLSYVVEFVIGKVNETIQRVIDLYRPDSLIVGTRGRSESRWRSALMGSCSKYCVGHSPVPVVVVRPQRKIKKSLDKRRGDPKRRTYIELVNPDGSSRNSHSDRLSRISSGGLPRIKSTPT